MLRKKARDISTTAKDRKERSWEREGIRNTNAELKEFGIVMSDVTRRFGIDNVDAPTRVKANTYDDR